MIPNIIFKLVFFYFGFFNFFSSISGFQCSARKPLQSLFLPIHFPSLSLFPFKKSGTGKRNSTHFSFFSLLYYKINWSEWFGCYEEFKKCSYCCRLFSNFPAWKAQKTNKDSHWLKWMKGSRSLTAIFNNQKRLWLWL
jgi:hypothetical protein